MKHLNTIPLPYTATILVDDSDSRVERIALRDGSVVRKTYTTSPLLVWRSLFRRSRSRREFENLWFLRARGIPVVEPVSWQENRTCGLTLSCALTTRYLPGATDLAARLRSPRSASIRSRLARRMGALIRALHDAGICSTTASPRNVLVRDSREGVELSFCDQPFAVRAGRGLTGRWIRELDLFDVFFSPNRLRDWSRTERWRGVLSYCDGNGQEARVTWRRLRRKRRWMHRCVRELARAFRRLPARNDDHD